jgi:NhaP-type Na+/H+ and K+/H+ antiporter
MVFGTAARVVLSPALVFLVVGAFAARLGWVSLRGDSPAVDGVIDVALFTVLFTAGATLLRSDADPRRPLAGRLLSFGIGLIVAVVGVAVLAQVLLGFGWLQAVLVGAALAPTGPLTTFLRELPAQWSGLVRGGTALTAGLAVSLLVLLTNAARGQDFVAAGALPLVGGLALGVALPAFVHLVLRLPGLNLGPRHQPVAIAAVALLLYAVAHLTGVNPYLAGFAGGAMVGWLDPLSRDTFAGLGEQLAGLAGAAAMLIFGALLSPTLVLGTSGTAWLAVLLFVVVVRPAATAVSLLGTAPGGTALAAGWIAPQPFTSVILALLVLRSGIPDASVLYGFMAVCLVAAVVVHAATDVVVTRFGGAGELVERSGGSATWTSSAKPFSTR